MKVVIFGVAVGNPREHPQAVMWPPLIRELHALGHRVIFFQRGAANLQKLETGEFVAYPDWKRVRPTVAKHLADADASIVTSASADVAEATREVLESNTRVRCFYDLDPAATLGLQPSRVSGQSVPPGGLDGFDVVLSYSGGGALPELKSRLHARHVVPLYGCVDPNACRVAKADDLYRAELSYLGSWGEEFQPSLDRLFLEPARRRPELRFTASGLDRCGEWNMPENVTSFREIPAEDYPRFYCSSHLTLALASRSAAEMGYCPSSQIFEAAACGVPVITDDWEGLDYFFEAAREILVARTTGHVMDALAMPPERLAQIGRAGRDRVLSAHTAARRALDLENILEAAISLPVEQTGAVRE